MQATVPNPQDDAALGKVQATVPNPKDAAAAVVVVVPQQPPQKFEPPPLRRVDSMAGYEQDFHSDDEESHDEDAHDTKQTTQAKGLPLLPSGCVCVYIYSRMCRRVCPRTVIFLHSCKLCAQDQKSRCCPR